FRDCLNLSSPVGREDSFYALGGDSIKAIRVVSLLRQKGIVLTVAQLIKVQAVYKLAEVADVLDDTESFEGFFDMMTVPVEESFSSPEEYERISSEFAQKGEVIERAYPLTFMQQSMLLTALADPDTSTYHVNFRASLGILPDERQLAYALGKVLQKHEVLRTAIIHEGVAEPRQAIVSGRELPLSFADLSSESDMTSAISAFDRQEFNKKIDLTNDALFRLVCIKTGSESCCLLFAFHHIILDGWCNTLWMGDFFRYLTEAVTGNEHDEDFSEQYGRYERHVRDIISRDKEAALGYWKELLADYETKAEIPSYEKVTAENRASENSLKLTVSPETTSKLENLCRQNNCTVNNAVEAAWALTLHTFTRNDDAVFVKVVSGRDNSQEDMSDVVGLFINSVPVRVKRAENTTLLDLLKSCHSQAADTNEHDWVPLSDIQQQSELGSNLFQSIVVFENFATGDTSSSDNLLKIGQVAGNETNSAEIMLLAYIGGDSLVYEFKYDIDKYTPSSISRIASLFERYLTSIASDPGISASHVSLVSEAENAELSSLGTGPVLEYDRNETFIDSFLRTVKRSPDSIAVADINSSLTYRELDKRSDAVASYLIDRGIQQDDFVAVLMPRMKEFIVSVLGIWKAGGAYVPVDPEYPEERRAFMIEDCEAKVVLTPETFDETDFGSMESSPLNHSTPAGVAYMIYTSGSTGKPKGVMIQHKAYFNYMNFYARQQGLTASDRMGCHRNFCFDASLEDLYPILSVGGELHLMPDEIRKDLYEIRRFIVDRKLTCISFTTSLGEMLLNEYPDLPLRFMVVSGEKLNPISDLRLPLWNFYGPTECTVDCVTYLVDKTRTYNNVPIGHVVDNLQALILDKDDRIVPRGIAGELCIVGPQVSKGYWKRPELTAEKFVECPYCPGEKMYRTGDLVRWNELGEMEYFGRIDNQVKLRGFRVEMGEIEMSLLKIAGIKASVAQVKVINGIEHLCAYYVSESEIDESLLRTELSKTLTEYMVPDVYVHMEAFPMTPSGKVDRKVLPVPEISGSSYVAPQNDIEQLVADTMQEVLNLPNPVGRNDGFYSLGGDSIKAIRMVSLLRQSGLQLSVAQIIKLQTVSALAEIAESVDDSDDFSSFFDTMTVPVEESFSSPEEYEKISAEFAKCGEEIERAYPLTSMQQGMLLTALSEPTSSAYHITMRFSLGILPTESQ
ncbi:MAG: amino acid adenylation domain-containing protein, partial [Oscillospiraceae bacterium]|nr:amino acid adenylation domain-containing protein [Oscillospiraceae bacterium]